MNSEKEIRKVLKAIVAELDVYALQESSPALLTGRCGIILFYAYYYRFTGKKKYLELLGTLVGRSINDLSEQSLGYNFCSGIAGIAWTLQHLVHMGLMEEEDLGTLPEECDQVLAVYLQDALQHDRYDFLHEGLGVVLYFLERMPGEQAKEQLDLALDLLARSAVALPGGISWQDNFTTKEKAYKDEACYNLGLAHGMPAILNIIGLIHEKGIGMEKAAALMEKGTEWLMSTRHSPDTPLVSLYPRIVTRQGKAPEACESRLGWCYGDLSIAHTLLNTGLRLGRQAYLEEAFRIYNYSLLHRNKENGSVADASYCHGSAGIAHMYRNAHSRSGQAALLEGAERWMQETLQLNNCTQGVAGYLYHTLNSDDKSYNLLDGVAGIGLALITALEPEQASGWDRCFLLS